MTYGVWRTLVGWAGVLGLAVALMAEVVRTMAAPPLSLDGYRDEKLPEGPPESHKLDEINENCFVCHGNYRTEELVVSHARARIGCIQCHGLSLAHQRDEDHRTPPDRMYAPEAIDQMCQGCHETHDVAAVRVLERRRNRCPQKTNPSEIVCTDCHYDHRLASRGVVWDRKSRKVLPAGKPGVSTKPRLPPPP